jgi:hypothetical protein
MRDRAQAFDSYGRRFGGPPPRLTALVETAAGSSLARFYPYTSHAVLRFATAWKHWIDPRPQPPVSIGIAGGPDEYIVWWGQLLSDLERETPIMLSEDPLEVVRLAELLLRPGRMPTRSEPGAQQWRRPSGWRSASAGGPRSSVARLSCTKIRPTSLAVATTTRLISSGALRRSTACSPPESSRPSTEETPVVFRAEPLAGALHGVSRRGSSCTGRGRRRRRRAAPRPPSVSRGWSDRTA